MHSAKEDTSNAFRRVIATSSYKLTGRGLERPASNLGEPFQRVDVLEFRLANAERVDVL